MFSLFGFSELSVLDLFMGFASGVFGTNVREEWHECMGGPLTMFRDILKLTMEFIGQDWTNIAGIFSNVSLLTKIAGIVVSIFTELPKSVSACSGVYTEVSSSVNFIIKHINPATLLTNAVTNLLTHILALLSDVWNLLMAMFSMNFYEIGRLSGEMFIMITN
jgi:hypothetical protein